VSRGRALAATIALLGLGAFRAKAVAGNMPTFAPCDAPCPEHRFVWTWWVGAGGGVRGLDAASTRAIFAPRLGASAVVATTGAGEFHLLLVGPWLEAETQLDGVLGEGGLELVLTPSDNDGKLSYGLRLGGSYGFDDSGRAARISATLTVGLRSVPVLDGCPIGLRFLGFQMATGVRVFATVRTAPEGHGTTLIGGVELEPSMLFRSIDWDRQGGNGGCMRYEPLPHP
jgi:hypothetical protein